MLLNYYFFSVINSIISHYKKLLYINIISLSKGVFYSLSILIPSTQLYTRWAFWTRDTVDSSYLKQSIKGKSNLWIKISVLSHIKWFINNHNLKLKANRGMGFIIRYNIVIVWLLKIIFLYTPQILFKFFYNIIDIFLYIIILISIY